MKKPIVVFADGGSRGNPGPAAVGFIIQDASGKVITRQSQAIGRATNNVAEYTAVIEALKWLKKNLTSINGVNFFLDSKLVVNQLSGLYKIKNAGLRNLIVTVRQLENDIGGNVSYCFIPREKNKIADALVNQSLKKS